MSLPEPSRAEINRANALTHGLTSSKLILLPTEDPGVFKQFRAEMFSHLAPTGPDETALAETIVAQHWRLQRIPSLEASILTTSSSAAADLSKLSLHEQRLTRLLNQNRTTLAALQTARRAAEHEQMAQAAALRKLHKDHNRAFNPANFGFVFSIDEIDRYRSRCTEIGAAKIYAQNAAQAFLNPDYRPKEVIVSSGAIKPAA